MKLRSLSAALVLAGITAVSTQAQAQGPVPDLTVPEQSGFVVLESALSAFAALIEANNCADFTFAAGTGFYGFKVETEWDGYGYATIDLLTMNVAPGLSSNKGYLWDVTGGGTIAGKAVVDYKGSYGFDKGGSILYGNADMQIHNDLYDEHIIKDFWDIGTVSEKLVQDDGYEVITKQRYPRAKWFQTSFYDRDNGGDGSLFWDKTQIAPDSANLGSMVVTASTDGFGDGFETFGGLVVLTCNN